MISFIIKIIYCMVVVKYCSKSRRKGKFCCCASKVKCQASEVSPREGKVVVHDESTYCSRIEIDNKKRSSSCNVF